MSSEPLLGMPRGFLWGVATAAHQNEGANTNNQWSLWEREPGRIAGGGRSDRTTGWWDLEQAAADFDRAASLGINSLRLSVEWSRIEPEPDRFDATALRRYAAMIGLLRARGIEPMVTLHHFTDPLWLIAAGGWENAGAIDRFGRFAGQVVSALGDRVNLWCTVNEPVVYAFMGYLGGYFPPGAKNLARTLRVGRNLVLGHARAYRVIHELQLRAQVGLAHHLRLFRPANPARASDRRAAAALDRFANLASLEAITNGRLIFPFGRGQILPELVGTSDFIGLNYYTAVQVAADPRRPSELFTRQFFANGETTDLLPNGDPYSVLEPSGLYEALMRLAAYRKPIFVTENGLPDHDDDLRPGFLASYLAEVWRAIRDGADVRGYYYWTLVDNFEWAAGWTLRFGLFELNQESGVRTPRASASVFAALARANGVPVELLRDGAPSAPLAAYLAALEPNPEA
jgi:beta-glucosidase